MSDDFATTGTQLYSQFIHKSRYARWLDDENRRETWDETVDRYINFFKNKYPDAVDYQEIRDAIYNVEVMPSMRALMTAGPALEKCNVSGYNCSYVTISHPRAFDEMMYCLMSGVGVGFSVERQYISKLPEVAEKLYPTDSVIVVPDSRRGWCKSFKELISLLYSGCIPTWDLSKLRKEGERLKTFGGRSSGPRPLDELFKFTVSTFKRSAGRKLTSLECHDLCCKIAEIVVAGGVRRSALISLSNPSDDRMRDAKAGQWWVDNGQRALSNNSASYTEKPDFNVFLKEWQALYASKSGERGFFSRYAAQKKAAENGLRSNTVEYGCNPCCLTGDMQLLTPNGFVTFAELAKKEDSVLIINNDGYVTEGKVWSSGVKPTVYIHFADESIPPIQCTDDHRFLTVDGLDLMARDLLNKNLAASDRMYVTKISPAGDAEVFDFTEPSTHWAYVSSNGIHPVVAHNSEIILRPEEFCNLSEVIVRSTDTLEDLKRKVRIATIIGTLQSTLTDFAYLRSSWKKNCEEERLLGVSLTGIQDHAVLGTIDDYGWCELSQWLTEMKAVTRQANAEAADKLGISHSTAITTVKPSGTVSQLTNTASGIHARFSKYYIRRVRADINDPLAQFMVESGFPYDVDVTNPKSLVFDFPIASPDNAKVVADVSAIDQLKIWKIYQDYWCDHKPSCTVYYSDDEFLEVGSWLWNNFDDVSGISFLPKTDHIYQQAPYEEITKEKYLELEAKIPKSIDWVKLSSIEKEDHTTGSQTLACSGNSCDIVDLTSN